MKEVNETVVCCITGQEFSKDDSHNAQPLIDGRCTKEVNDKIVLPYRFYLMMQDTDPKKAMESLKKAIDQTFKLQLQNGIVDSPIYRGLLSELQN